MIDEQKERYADLSNLLLDEMKAVLCRGDRTLLGVVLNCLLAWPGCCFREKNVVHPRTKQILAFVPGVLDETPSPKETIMIRNV